jgi:hypothetical protein
MSDAEREQLLVRISQEVAKVRSGKLVIRAVPSESWRVTIVAIQKKSNTPDVFLRL